MVWQLLAPVGGSDALSFLVALIPIAVVLVSLGILRRPAWQASAAGLVTAFPLAIFVWGLPATIAASSFAAGATFAVWPVMWIVLNALLLYNLSTVSGSFDGFRVWMLRNLPDDSRVILVVIGFSFGCLLEGVAGFGAPIAITSALLVAIGFRAMDAVVYTLIFNTAPVAFGALGAPITTLAAVTQLPDVTLGAMVGRQMPLIALLLPFYVIIVYGGFRALRGVWPVLLVAGGSFAVAQFVCSNLLSYALTDVISSLLSLLVTLLFVKVWRVPPNREFALAAPDLSGSAESAAMPAWRCWAPWIILAATVIVWVHLKINLFGLIDVEWPGLHNKIFITAYGRPYAAIWSFQPLATGTAILLATSIVAICLGVSVPQLRVAVANTLRQIRLPLTATMLIVGLAYVMNYSGMTYTLGNGIASAGFLFPLVSAFLGWLAVFLTGSDTSGNALFGNLQVVAANKLDLSPILMAATNASGGVMGKMVSPQNILTGTSTTDLKGREGEVLARTFRHSIGLTLFLGVIVMLQQHVFPWIIAT